ncbi:endonuclease VII [Mycobacterium phage Finemlucis]|uniref:Endonuclease VII n=1 Tax=Mycobacterium phage Finemlucis TaxID=2015844 RepID=A0A291I9V3_9CAUD|nr:endonuclease VII [Mycobacterium phage Finemlucis]ATG86482.1 endonuclease VII [Mycobacterium phage Finemlucis]QGZ16641.1 endonuclease VII [Mycobacterium phage Gabriela]
MTSPSTSRDTTSELPEGRKYHSNKGKNCLDCEKPATHKLRCHSHYLKHRSNGTWRERSLRKHGLTEKSYTERLDQQGGVCAICKGPNRDGWELCVDHDHACCPKRDKSCGNCVRGLLCHNCNFRLGHLEAILRGDEWVREALAYLGKT